VIMTLCALARHAEFAMQALALHHHVLGEAHWTLAALADTECRFEAARTCQRPAKGFESF
jgi:hypothetical protein